MANINHIDSEMMQIKANTATVKFLEHRGYTTVNINDNRPAPIIVKDEDDTLVFVSVQVSEGGFESEETPREVMESVAAEWLAAHGDEIEGNTAIRFDVVGVLVVSENRALLRHHINAYGLA